jgi:HK97 family phage prohead protease/HK97 family phage major capsid protein
MVDKDKLLYLSVNSTVVKSELPAGDDQPRSVTISGYASTNDIDRQGDVVPVSVWEKGMANYLKNPVILAFHNHDNPVGRMVDHRVDSKGLWIKARISSAATNVFQLVSDGILTAFSIGFRIVDAEYNQATELFVVKELELHEISVVSVPANQNTLFSLEKAFDSAAQYQSFKMQFAPNSESAKGLESSTEAESKPTSKEWKMSPEEIKQVLADAARQAAEDATKAVFAQQDKARQEKAAKEAAEAELEAKIKAAVASTVETGQSGAERLLAEVEKRFAEQADQSKNAIAGLESALREKAAELEVMQRSKMSFADKGDKDNTSYADRETAVLLAKSMNRRVEDTKFGRQLIEKAGAHQPTNANVNYWETEVSTNMEMEVRRRLVVAPLVRSIPMQNPVMAIPVNPETGTAQWTGTSTPYSTAGTGTANTTAGGTTAGNFRGSPHQLKEVLLQSYKVATNEYLAYEEEEDSIIVLMPIIRDAMVRRIARAIDAAYLRGAGGAAADPVKGIATYDAVSAINIDRDGNTLATGSFTKANSVAALRALRKDLGLWGLDPSGIVYVVSQDIYYNLLEDTNFMTMDKVGTQATLLTGQIGAIGNSPVLVSGEFAAEGDGVIAGVCFAPGNFLAGNQRGLRVDTQELVETQRRVMVASMRVGLTQVTTAQGDGVSTLKYVA